MNPPDADPQLPALRRQNHPECFVCGPANGHGLGLRFRVVQDGAVEASFPCHPVFVGYPQMLHGGIICTLLDGAMTNCLFARGLAAVTIEISVRFRHPVAVGLPAVVRAWLESEGSPIYRLRAELVQGGQVVATARGRFVRKGFTLWPANKKEA